MVHNKNDSLFEFWRWYNDAHSERQQACVRLLRLTAWVCDEFVDTETHHAYDDRYLCEVLHGSTIHHKA